MKTPMRTHEGRVALVTGAAKASARRSRWRWQNEARR